ncbi:SGNH/GDSL hydrolase family protein [Roseateles sp. LYH14W]|uniref:SGNH/GDSL hydrolase family protein n=1 Tax=Pelomonas parva TaxID=3299032 RepID=A0ABW7F7X6_9BURK
MKDDTTIAFPTIIALGDSWFWYLKNNVATPLHSILNKRMDHIILVRGANGAEAQEYTSGVIFQTLERDLDKTRGYGKTIKAVFLSGGGNDLAGPEDFLPLLEEDCSKFKTAEACLRIRQPGKLFGKVTSALGTIIELVENKIPGTPVFAHSYDYANPNGLGFFGLGQWLRFPMDQCKVPRSLQQDLINLLIDRYWEAMVKLRKQFPQLQLIDQRGTLGRDEWANELHPTPAGFKKIAKRWKPQLEAAGLA